MTSMTRYFSNRREYLLLAAMLECLHIAIWSDLESTLSQAMIIAHLGFFLLWQPIERRDQSYTWYNGLLIIGLLLVFALFINWWLIFIWIVVLLGIIGGRVVNSTSERYVYYLVLILLFSELLIACLPEMFSITTSPEGMTFLYYLLGIVPLLLPFFRSEKRTRVPVDILYAITTSLLVSLIALGTLVIMYSTETDYVTALIRMLLAIGFFLIFISWLASGQLGVSSLSQRWTKSLLNIGTPFESWLYDLSRLKDQHDSADAYLEEAIAKLLTLDWVSGVRWRGQTKGKKTRYHIELKVNNEPIELYTHIRIGGALLLHCQLLLRLIDYFYQAKMNEIKLAKQAHLEAIHETGARITHDIKNLLQSMHSMVTILQADHDSADAKSLLVLKRQFPYFIQRLEQAVSKIQSPEQLITDKIHISDWWRECKNHYRPLEISFEEDIQYNHLIPFDLFDSVVENLVDNAINKRKIQPEVKIKAALRTDADQITLEIADTGHAISPKISASLFNEPVHSDSGLGIGLFQAAKQAQAMGYELILSRNSENDVRFVLTGKAVLPRS